LTLKKDLENRVRGWIPKEPKVPISKIKAAKISSPPKVMRIAIMVGILVLMIVAAVMFLVPFMAESYLNHAIVRLFWLVSVVALVGIAIYLKRRGPRDGSKSQLFVEFMYKKYRSRPVYLVIFGLVFGFMLSGLAVAILGQPLPVHYSVPLFFAFIGVGAVIGDLIGRKLDYRWPLLP